MDLNTSAIVTLKSVSTGGIGALLMSTFNDVEFVMLLIAGVFASVMSYVYDWSHRDKRKFGLVEFTEFGKSVFYGIPVMFIVYHFGVHNAGGYIDAPLSVWGFIAMLSAGSAVAIVEWFTPILGNTLSTVFNKKTK